MIITDYLRKIQSCLRYSPILHTTLCPGLKAVTLIRTTCYHLPTYPQNIQPHGNVLNCPVIMPSKKVV